MSFFNDFFSWSKKERLGVIVLSSFVFLLFFSDIFFNRIYPFKDYSIHPDTLVIYRHLLEELEADLSLISDKSKPNKENSMDRSLIKKDKKLHMFDPNKLDEDGWVTLGFSKKQSQAIVNYREMLGGFMSKEDLHASFVVDDEKFKELEPYIKIRIIDKPIDSRKEEGNEQKYKMETKEEVLFIELNSTDSIALLKLFGIGPFYAGKIIAYRNQLGGYFSIDQLVEIWNFDTIKLNNIAEQIWVDTNLMRSLRINSDSVQVLYKHPYIAWNQAKAIINYREQHGRYESVSTLLEIVLIDDSLLTKLYPYISLK